MAAQTNLDNIKSVTRGVVEIQRLVESDLIVGLVLDWVDIQVSEATYGRMTESAQRYLAAHLLAQSLHDPGGRGPLSSETIGGITQSWTQPHLTPKSVLGATQYGMMFMQIRDMAIVPAIFVPPSCS